MSGKYLLNAKDFAKGAFMFVLSAVITYIIQAFGNGSLTNIDWSIVGNVAVTAFLSYILKNYFSDQNGKVFGRVG